MLHVVMVTVTSPTIIYSSYICFCLTIWQIMHSSVCQGNIQHLPNLIMNSVTQNYIIDLHFVWVLKTATNISCFIKPSFNTTAVVSTYHGGFNMHQQLGVDLGEGAWNPPPPPPISFIHRMDGNVLFKY